MKWLAGHSTSNVFEVVTKVMPIFSKCPLSLLIATKMSATICPDEMTEEGTGPGPGYGVSVEYTVHGTQSLHLQLFLQT